MKLKDDVRVLGTRNELTIGLLVAWGVFMERGLACVITGAIEGKHSRASLHYAGDAVDLRIRHVAPDQREQIADEIRDRIGPDFDVVLESDPPHIHIEFQPKRPYTE
jgi:hypothetical protein